MTIQKSMGGPRHSESEKGGGGGGGTYKKRRKKKKIEFRIGEGEGVLGIQILWRGAKSPAVHPPPPPF